MPPNPAPITAPRAQVVQRIAEQLGFALVGIAPAEPTHYAEHIRQWLSEGRHGEMAYIKNQLEERLDPCVLVPGAKSIICVADRYGGEEEERRAKSEERGKTEESKMPASASFAPHSSLLAPRSSSPTGRIARYAWSNDYHWVIKDRLHEMADALRGFWPDHVYRSTVDTAPILEREHAARAGLGWVGKNTLLIHPAIGSYILLGEIVTTLFIQPTVEAGHPPIADHCGTCTRCIDACPTHCITPHNVDASRCISYLTLEHRGPIAPELHAPMGEWLAGCDVCQEVCPFNDAESGRTKSEERGTKEAPRSSLLAPLSSGLPLLDILNWDAAARQTAFERSALKRLKLDQLKRNALIAAGNHLANHEDPALLQRIKSLAADPNESELVRLTAHQVLTRLA